MIYPNLFKNRYPELKGKNWIKRVMPEDQRAFIEIGLLHAQNGHLGGVARSKTGKRNPKGMGRLSGRFVKENIGANS